MKKVYADGSVVEGTFEEIAQYEALTKQQAGSTIGEALDAFQSEIDWEYVSTDVGFRALTRVKLGNQIRTILQMLHKAGELWTSAKALQELIEYSPSQFAGAMGAFGRRIANTPGYVRDSSFFEYEWNDRQSCYLYRLPPSSRLAVEKARIVD